MQILAIQKQEKPSIAIWVRYRHIYILSQTAMPTFSASWCQSWILGQQTGSDSPHCPIPFCQEILHALNSTAHFWSFEVNCLKGYWEQVWLEQCGKMETFCWQSVFTAKSWWKPSAFLGKAPSMEKLFFLMAFFTFPVPLHLLLFGTTALGQNVPWPKENHVNNCILWCAISP